MNDKTGKGVRLDRLLYEKGWVESREKAQALIMEGNVVVNGVKAEKAGMLVKDDACVELLQKIRYVSRGGMKLEHALKEFRIDVAGKRAMDVGASTGGFTDCLLQHGAAKVIAVDVGYGQFHWNLRKDERVVLIEKTNIRYLEKDILPYKLDIITIDVSFISLLTVIPKILEFLKPSSEVVALIKPQFEVGREDVGKGGIVRDEKKRLETVERIKKEVLEMGLEVIGVTESPVKGPKGNVEYLIYFIKP
ncbi:MAG: TlyA family RNA methyltransferase [Nitrospirae bacterium]|nr:TlyA family RNA methyltransferase [Nitrospirota bacterium]